MRRVRALGLLLFLGLWQLLASLAASRIFPTPLMVLGSLGGNWQVLLAHSWHSLWRLLAGVAAALVVGMPIGWLLGYFPKADALFSPAVYVGAPIPKIALLPLIMLLLGIGDLSKVFIIFIIMVFQVVTAARDGVRKIPGEYFMPYRAAGVGDRQILLQIIVPASVPELFTALRIGFATSISVLFFAETFGTRWGLGFYIMDMWMRLEYAQMYLGICTLGLMGFLLVFGADRLEKRVCPWK